jgi:hypothetical protein
MTHPYPKGMKLFVVTFAVAKSLFSEFWGFNQEKL